MSPSRGSGSWNSDYARTDRYPRYSQAPNGRHNDYQFSSREYQSYPTHTSGSTSDVFYSDDQHPRFSSDAYLSNYTNSSRIRRRSPNYAEFREEDYSAHGPYREWGFSDSWVESERDSHSSSRRLDYSRLPSNRDYDLLPSGSRGYHSNTRDYDGYILPRYPSNERDMRRDLYTTYGSQWRGPETGSSREDYRDSFGQTDNQNSSYSTYRRPPPEEDSSERHTYSSYQSRPSPPPSDRCQPTHPLPPRPSPGPPLTRRMSPTNEYIEVSRQPPSHLPDASISRKLIVLDLNGSLLVRGAHTARVPTTRKGGGSRPFDPYANPTQPRPLRPVHPRPYLKSFTTYLLHDKTKKWLDTMVWSSAQPHSVDDMVGKTFLERKDELTAVWARDTLGLTTEEYHSKFQTMKDLAKPWAELNTLKASYLTEDQLSGSNRRSTSKSPSPRSTTKPTDRIESTDPRPQRHSALSSLLVDDSPLKAALQPWNHLCIREYVQEMRRHDLVVAECEAARERMRKAAEDREALERRLAEEESEKEKKVEDSSMGDGGAAKGSEEVGDTEQNSTSVRQVIRELVMVDGEMVGTAEVVRQVSREVVMIEGQMINPEEDPIAPTPLISSNNRRRRFKRLAKKYEMKKIREEKEREIFELLRQETEASTSASGSPAMVEGEGENKIPPTDASALGTVREQMDMRFDETLLAVIGVLDQIKNESNVAGWMRSGGLLHAARPSMQLPVNERAETPKAEKHPAPSRGESPSEEGTPAKKRRLHHKHDDSDAELEVQPLPPSSPLSIIPPSSQRYETDIKSYAEDKATPEEDKTDQSSTGIPLSAPPPDSPLATDIRPKDLWYQDPAVLNYWVDRGRRALELLGIEVESGIEPIPGGLVSHGKS